MIKQKPRRPSPAPGLCRVQGIAWSVWACYSWVMEIKGWTKRVDWPEVAKVGALVVLMLVPVLWLEMRFL